MIDYRLIEIRLTENPDIESLNALRHLLHKEYILKQKWEFSTDNRLLPCLMAETY